MTNRNDIPEKPAFSRRPVGKLGLLLILLPIGVFISILSGATLWLDVLYRLACGWISFLLVNINSLTLNWEMLGCGIGALAFGTLGLHRLILWLRRGNPWKWAWTLSITALTLMLFAASIAMTGIIHQLGWMTREPLTQRNNRAHITLNISNAKQIFYLLIEYDDENGMMPQSLEEFKHKGYTGNLHTLQFHPEGGQPPEPWIFLGGGESLLFADEATQQGERIIMIAPMPIRDKWVVLQNDGSAKALLTENIRENHPYVLEKVPNLFP